LAGDDVAIVTEWSLLSDVTSCKTSYVSCTAELNIGKLYSWVNHQLFSQLFIV